MAITKIENGQQVPLHVFAPNGYMYTVGPRSGVGKLYQPGTRGLVVDDCAKSGNRPNFTWTYRSQSQDWISRNMDNGYFAMWTENGNQVVAQPNAPYTDTLGLASDIIQDLNSKWLFPTEIPSSAFYYTIDDSRYGDKPISGPYSLLNDTYRALLLPNVTIYKWETHVVVATNSSDVRNMNHVLNVYVPYVRNIDTPPLVWAYKKLVLTKTKDTGTWKYRYFSGEFSQNLPTGTGISYPVIQVTDPAFAVQSQGSTTYVQAKYCFKND